MSPKPLTELYVLEEIGQGSQGKLYKATDRESGAVTALKRLQLSRATRWEDVQRLRDNARALENILHPNVVAYHDFDEREDEYGSPEFLLRLEYVDGKSLNQARQEGKRFTAEELQSIARQTLDGLAAAHARGIIHRDVKPSNILLMEDGKIKIADFGIAKFLGEETRGSSHAGKGTTEYMTPEQLDRRMPITAATDYFGLGLTLLELATGRERLGAYFQEDPKEDIARLRSSGHYSEEFVSSLELLVDADPVKRKEGVRRIREEQVVPLEESVAGSEAGTLENCARGKTYEELVKWERANERDYALLGTVGGGVSTILLEVVTGLSGNWDFVGEAALTVLIQMPFGCYLGYKTAQFTNWRRRRKAEKAASVKTLKHYDAEIRRGTKEDTTLVGLLIEGEQYAIDTHDLQCFTEMAFHRVYHGEKNLSFAYQVIAHDTKKKSAKVLTVTDPPVLQKIQQEVNRIQEHEETLLPGSRHLEERISKTKTPEELFGSSETVEEATPALAEK